MHNCLHKCCIWINVRNVINFWRWFTYLYCQWWRYLKNFALSFFFEAIYNSFDNPIGTQKPMLDNSYVYVMYQLVLVYLKKISNEVNPRLVSNRIPYPFLYVTREDRLFADDEVANVGVSPCIIWKFVSSAISNISSTVLDTSLVGSPILYMNFSLACNDFLPSIALF